jgi:hypothetical protein
MADTDDEPPRQFPVLDGSVTMQRHGDSIILMTCTPAHGGWPVELTVAQLLSLTSWMLDDILPRPTWSGIPEHPDLPDRDGT